MNGRIGGGLGKIAVICHIDHTGVAVSKPRYMPYSTTQKWHGCRTNVQQPCHARNHLSVKKDNRINS
jgi:hypothetical protein